MKNLKHPWRGAAKYKIPVPDYFYSYDSLEDLPIMSDSKLIEMYSFRDRKIKVEDVYD